MQSRIQAIKYRSAEKLQEENNIRSAQKLQEENNITAAFKKVQVVALC